MRIGIPREVVPGEKRIAATPAGVERLVASTHIIIIGGGTVGRSAAAAACGLGARVTVVDRDPEHVRERLLRAAPAASLQPEPVTRAMVGRLLPEVDAVINGVLWDPLTGEHLVTREGLKRVKRGSVIVDVDCTPNGVIETTRAMTLDNPTFAEEGVIHYCVPNMPATVPQTSTRAYAGALLPYLELIARRGVDGAMAERTELAAGPQPAASLPCWAGRWVTSLGRRQTVQVVSKSGRYTGDTMSMVSPCVQTGLSVRNTSQSRSRPGQQRDQSLSFETGSTTARSSSWPARHSSALRQTWGCSACSIFARRPICFRCCRQQRAPSRLSRL